MKLTIVPIKWGRFGPQTPSRSILILKIWAKMTEKSLYGKIYSCYSINCTACCSFSYLTIVVHSPISRLSVAWELHCCVSLPKGYPWYTLVLLLWSCSLHGREWHFSIKISIVAGFVELLDLHFNELCCVVIVGTRLVLWVKCCEYGNMGLTMAWRSMSYLKFVLIGLLCKRLNLRMTVTVYEMAHISYSVNLYTVYNLHFSCYLN